MTERPHRIVVVGAGYVGLVTAVGLADMCRVELVETRPDRLAALRDGRAPIHEAGLLEEPSQPSVRRPCPPGTV